jgi:S-adenosylmethionine decarboxylase
MGSMTTLDSSRSAIETAPWGMEWIVDAHGCSPALLRSVEALRAVFDCVVEQVGLHPLSEAAWHVFPGDGGISGLLPLRESHLACHTFPEHAYAAFSLYCCGPRPEWRWAERLEEMLGARQVVVRSFARGQLERTATAP